VTFLLFFILPSKSNLDENSRIRIRYPLVRVMDSRIPIRIRIRAKISWIRNTAGDNVANSVLGTFWPGGGRLWKDLSRSKPVRICKRLRSPGIDSDKSIPPG
jgi:hypothetical protein